MTVQAGDFTAGERPDGVYRVLRLQQQVGMFLAIDPCDPLEPNADAGEFFRHMGKPVGRSIEVDDQTLHFHELFYSKSLLPRNRREPPSTAAAF